MTIYVETIIDAPLERVWEHSQRPELHQQWDLRFSEITYLPRASEQEPQRFLYVTRIGFGLEISGTGESTGTRDLADGSRTSALRFASAHPLSLIREGSGYWKYVPTGNGTRFFTAYDYETRWGAFGALIDRIAFRPLMGWATAWSFDRFRRWLEQGVDPASAARQAIVHAVARVALALILAYHGLVPKLLGPHADELRMLQDAGISTDSALRLVMTLGAAEVTFALVLLLAWRRAWAPALLLLFMPFATVSVLLISPQFIGSAFNAVTLNLAVACLALIDIVSVRDLATASRCLRRKPETRP